MSMLPDDTQVVYVTIPGNHYNAKLKTALDKLRALHPDWFDKQTFQTTLWEDHYPMKPEATEFIADLILSAVDEPVVTEQKIRDPVDEGWKPIVEAPAVHGYRCYVEGKDGHRQHGFYVCEDSCKWIDERGGRIEPVRFKAANPDKSSKWFLSDTRMSDVVLK